MADPPNKKPYEDIRILILEDNPADAELLENELLEAGFIFKSQLVKNKQSYVKALREFYPDIILSDYDLPGFSGVEALRIRKDMSPEAPFILVTGAVGEERAIEILTGGATDYVLKKNLSRLLPAVSRALHEAYEHRKRKEAEADRDSLMNDLERRVRERTEAFQAEITERKRAEEARSRQVAFENIISKILARFASCTAAEVDDEITAGLKEIGLFLKMERGFRYPVLEGITHMGHSLRLDRTGSPSIVQKYQNVPYGTNPWSEKVLLGTEAIQLNSLDDLPPEAETERREWASQGLKSMLLVALRGRGARVIGSAGFRSYSREIQWTQEDIRSLRLFSDTVANVLERKRAEDAMLESEEKYRRIFESSLSGILITKPDGTIVSANPAAQQILGMTEEEIIQRGRNGIVDVSDPRIGSAMEELARNGKFFGELNWRKKDGSVFSVEGYSVIFQNKGGRILLSTIFRDVTRRIEAERKLKENEQRFREMANAMPQLVWTATPEGIMVYFNKRHEEFPELVRQDSGRWVWHTCIHPEDLPETLEIWRRAVEEQSDAQVEHRLRDKSGNYQWYLTRCVILRDEQGKAIQWVGTTTDIHNLKEAERILRERTNSLEETNKELESFSYSVSHDLRAPLRAIEGFSGMLLDHEKCFDDETKRRIQVIRANAVKMDRLINDLLYLSRSGRVPIFCDKIDMDRLVKEIWQEQISATPGRRLELKKGTLPEGLGDEALMRQVLSNLLANAVKFSKRKKQAVVEIGGGRDGEENVYYVRDNGTGFDMKYCDKLFGVFQRLHPESEYEGTGVGLAIVQRIIHRHGGRVWAEGKVGKGAIFYFSLPRVEK